MQSKIKPIYEIIVQPNAADPVSLINIIVIITDHFGVQRTWLNMTYDKKDEAKGRLLAQRRIDEDLQRNQ